MLHDNIMLQICAILSLIIVVLVFLATLIPQLEFDYDVEHPNIIRGILLMIIFGLLRGAL